MQGVACYTVVRERQRGACAKARRAPPLVRMRGPCLPCTLGHPTPKRLVWLVDQAPLKVLQPVDRIAVVQRRDVVIEIELQRDRQVIPRVRSLAIRRIRERHLVEPRAAEHAGKRKYVPLRASGDRKFGAPAPQRLPSRTGRESARASRATLNSEDPAVHTARLHDVRSADYQRRVRQSRHQRFHTRRYHGTRHLLGAPSKEQHPSHVRPKSSCPHTPPPQKNRDPSYHRNRATTFASPHDARGGPGATCGAARFMARSMAPQKQPAMKAYARRADIAAANLRRGADRR